MHIDKNYALEQGTRQSRHSSRRHEAGKMESLYSNLSRRSEDSNKTDAYPIKHHPHDHMLCTTPNIFHSTRNPNEHQNRKFTVPSASIPVIPLVFMSLLIPFYEFVFVPIIRKFTGHPSGITHLQRVGFGLVLSVISMGIAGVIEVKRKHELIHHNHAISLFWLSFHYAIFGIADMFTLVGLMEFFIVSLPLALDLLPLPFPSSPFHSVTS